MLTKYEAHPWHNILLGHPTIYHCLHHPAPSPSLPLFNSCLTPSSSLHPTHLVMYFYFDAHFTVVLLLFLAEVTGLCRWACAHLYRSVCPPVWFSLSVCAFYLLMFDYMNLRAWKFPRGSWWHLTVCVCVCVLQVYKFVNLCCRCILFVCVCACMCVLTSVHAGLSIHICVCVCLYLYLWWSYK